MTLFSPEYASLQSKFHAARPDYGISGCKYAEQIEGLAKQLQTRSVLDYGCGKCTLQKALPFPIQNYDPFIPEFAVRPQSADVVVCTDVMEHVEEGCVRSVLYDLFLLTKKAVFFQIATGPASKTLPDGRNAHITQRPSNWWLEVMLDFFDIKSFMLVPGGFVVIASPVEIAPVEDKG